MFNKKEIKELKQDIREIQSQLTGTPWGTYSYSYKNRISKLERKVELILDKLNVSFAEESTNPSHLVSK